MLVTQQPRADIGAQLRRVIKAILVDAHRLVTTEDTAESTRVHGARTRIKRIRALVALLRADLGHTSFRAEARALRDAARALGPLRDSVARLEAYDELSAHGAPGFPDEWREVLTRERNRALHQEITARILSQTAVRLAAAQARVESWPSPTHETESLAHGFLRNYARARRAFRSAKRNPTPEAMHALRRRTKRYQYHLRFLEPVGDRQMRARCHRVEVLSELLGKHHDLVLLSSALADESCGLKKLALRGLRRALERRERKLRRHALSLARRVYRKQPRQFARRLQRLLRRWHVSATQSPKQGPRELLGMPASLPVSSSTICALSLH
ncbi:MAG TPA: CHAD domain-containing protein [Polyangiaceae bacterium]